MVQALAMKLSIFRKSGFTLVEIMIVVAIVALLASIAVPTFMKYRTTSRRSACLANLRQIENAKIIWAQENRKAKTDFPIDADLFGLDKYLRIKPECAASGVYDLGTVDLKVSCSLATVEGHTF